ncbi:MAG: methyltransferase domain-containing protein [Paracoccaceae bacterium]
MPAPSMTSLSTRLAVPTQVWVCRACGHSQSADLPDVKTFYDSEYRISLQSEDHDQLYEIGPDGPIFRTERQTALLLELNLKSGARVLDFGAAKAVTLRRFFAARPDIQPFVFDVSEDYRSFWSDWIPLASQATYQMPEEWSGTFDLITAHFVLEHVPNPVDVLKNIAGFLSPEGLLFITVPDPIGNPGDLLVVDHLNHFVPSSIQTAMHLAGLRPILISSDKFRGAFVIVARLGESSNQTFESDPQSILEILQSWKSILSNLRDELDRPENKTARIAIYGAGFYGALFAPLVGDRLVAFIDMNPNLQGSEMEGRPVLAPSNFPSVDLVIAALNPARARKLLPANPPWLKGPAKVYYPGG